MDQPIRIADAFGAAVGHRAGIADPEALFALEPDAEAHKQAARLRGAVDGGDYAAALDALGVHPELANTRPLSRALIDELIAHSVREHRRRHQDDALAFAAILELGADDSQMLADVDDAETLAETHLREYLATPQVSAEELRAEIVRIVYGALAGLAIERVSARGNVVHLLGQERVHALEEQLRERGLVLADALVALNWQAQLQRLCAPGLAEHNRDQMREELRSAIEGALWQTLPPAST